MMELLGMALLAWPFTLMVLIIIALVIGIILAIIYAKKKGKSPLSWGVVGFLVVFMLIFWDWIPTKVAHQYYCSKEAGFWVYKTPDQWKQENPGVLETLTENTSAIHTSIGDSDSYVDTFPLNQRFNLVMKHIGPLYLNRWKREDELIDIKTNQVLSRYIDFSTSQYRRQAGWSGWKFWLDNEQCVGGFDNAIKSNKWIEQFTGSKG